MPKAMIDLMRPTLTFTPDKVTGKPQGTLPKPMLDFAVARGMLPKDVGLVLETGVDAVQALLFALQMIGAEVYTSSQHQSGRLEWLERGRGYGFPVPDNIRDLLVGDDKRFL